MKQVYHYLYEGECEKNLVCSLMSNGRIRYGRRKKLDLWKNELSKHIRLFNRSETVIVVFDTDVMSQYRRFVRNVILLAKHVRVVILLPQHENLEEEIAYACSIHPKDLPMVFYRLTSVSEFKTKFSKDRSLIRKLDTKGFDIHRIWCRGMCNGQLNLGPRSNLYWGTAKVLRS